MSAIGADELVRRLDAAVSAGDVETITRQVQSEIENVLQPGRLRLDERFPAARCRTTMPGVYCTAIRRAATPSWCWRGPPARGRRSTTTPISGASRGCWKGELEVTHYTPIKEEAHRCKFAPVESHRVVAGEANFLIPPVRVPRPDERPDRPAVPDHPRLRRRADGDEHVRSGGQRLVRAIPAPGLLRRLSAGGAVCWKARATPPENRERHGPPPAAGAFGPGLLWAATAIGVSHLVQSTRAGASAGFALAGVILIALVLKYPFFEYGPRYAAATGRSLIEGYARIGRWALWLYLAITVSTMAVGPARCGDVHGVSGGLHARPRLAAAGAGRGGDGAGGGAALVGGGSGAWTCPSS